MTKILKILKRLANKTLGTVSDSIFWKYRHFLDKKWSENYISEQSLAHPHRKILIEKIIKYSPTSVLEVGCASGPNLVLLAQKLPQAKLEGIDISPSAIETGRRYLELQKIKNVRLAVGNILNLKKFADKSFDVVFTDAVLIYVDKNKIENVLKEMVRVARKAVVLNEWLTDSEKSAYVGHWAHNYKNLFKKIMPNAEFALTKVKPDVWAGDWATYGYIIEAEWSNP
ncbi:MAG TPA: class I SAM-dependent methyltransferase [Candidatus Paceibacterota bacterium]|nr:class I SAM-dependent methyltransferase [Candidatus Paceibacterota bacterium]